MRGVRGGIADPGAYRRVQNWIGPPNSTEATATLVTCSAPEIGDAMGAWERYLHEDAPDALVQLGVVHAWFEAIHPFLDGNGRLGRLMVPLFLVAKGLLQRPNFYLSEYLERHREDYYRYLLAAQSGADWPAWLRFFLTALEQQAIANARKARQILTLYAARKDWVATVTDRSTPFDHWISFFTARYSQHRTWPRNPTFRGPRLGVSCEYSGTRRCWRSSHRRKGVVRQSSGFVNSSKSLSVRPSSATAPANGARRGSSPGAHEERISMLWVSETAKSEPQTDLWLTCAPQTALRLTFGGK